MLSSGLLSPLWKFLILSGSADSTPYQNRRRWETVDEPPQGDRLLPPMEHDGRDAHHERDQGGVLLRVRGLPQRP